MFRLHRARALAARTLVVAPVLAALAVALAWGGQPDAGPAGVAVAVQDDRLAVVPLAGIPHRLDLLAATGAALTRVDLLWSQVAPTRPRNPADSDDPAYRFGRYDRILIGLARRGIAPILSVFSSPRWAAGGREAADRRPVNPHAPDPAAFGDFMAAVARRYDGRHASGLGRLPEARRLELWNEPNLGFFLRPQVDASGRPVSAQRYAAMVRAGYRGAKSGNPRAIVIAGAAAARGASGASGVGALPWLRALGASGVPFDAYSQHLYPAAAPGVPTAAVPSWHTLPLLLDELDRIRPGTPLYITEAGYTTAPTPHHGSTVSPAEQAANLRQIFALPQVRPPRVEAVVWFNLQDNAAWPSGLVGLDGRAKPSLEAFRELAAGSPRGRPGERARAVIEALVWSALGAVVLAWLGSGRRPRAS
jgi:polysaccharide biosynthesis protein PslG